MKKISLYAIVTIIIFTNYSIYSSEKERAYQEYVQLQEKITDEALKLQIPGTRRLQIDEPFAEKVLNTCPSQINSAISSIEQNIFDDNEKNIIMHGPSGTSKSCLAQAIAIKTKTPCIIFNAGSISTQYMNSGVQNLHKIFEYARRVEKEHNKCIVILDEIEALTKKHTNKDSHENNILVSFWQEIDNLHNSNVMVIGTMNDTQDLPVQVTNRTSMIFIPLPKLKHREAVLSHHLEAKVQKHNLTYPTWITPLNLAYLTKGFSHRDLQNTITRATKPAILHSKDKTVSPYNFAMVIREIRKDPKRKEERSIGTWKHLLKKHIRDPKISISLFFGFVGTSLAYTSIRQGRQISDKQMITQEKTIMQSREIADKQMSFEHMSKQTVLNFSINGIPIGVIVYGLLKTRDGIVYTYNNSSDSSSKGWSRIKHFTSKGWDGTKNAFNKLLNTK